VSPLDEEGVLVDEVSDRLLEALTMLDSVADEVTAEEAVARLDEATLELFWRDWPRLAAWADPLWRQLEADLAIPSSSVSDVDLEEVGGEG
jgi:hypothetical protein